MTVSNQSYESASIHDNFGCGCFLETAECSCCKQLGLDGSCVSVTGNHCTACPAGQFQNKQAQNACSLCPAGWLDLLLNPGRLDSLSQFM